MGGVNSYLGEELEKVVDGVCRLGEAGNIEGWEGEPWVAGQMMYLQARGLPLVVGVRTLIRSGLSRCTTF